MNTEKRLSKMFNTLQSTQTHSKLLEELSARIPKNKDKWRKVLYYIIIGKTQEETAKICSFGVSTVKHYLKQMRDLKIIDYQNDVSLSKLREQMFSNDDL